MKRLLIAVLCASLLCGCGEQPKGPDGSYEFNEYGRILIDGRTEIKKVKIEGHEYLMLGVNNGGGICHSQSCPCFTSKFRNR